jgi:uncharacterized protein (DUF1778 family)
VLLDQEIKEKAEKASALLGLRSLTEYVVRLMEENSSKVIAEHESITVQIAGSSLFQVGSLKSSLPAMR